MDAMRSVKSSPTSASAISAQYRLWRAGYLIGVYAAVRREPDGGIWAAVRPSVASSTAPRRGSDVLLTTLDHPGAGVARDGAVGSSGSTRITFFKIHVCEPFAKSHWHMYFVHAALNYIDLLMPQKCAYSN